MFAALVLVGYALLAAGVGPGMLRRAAWPERWPGLGILAWQALSLSGLASVLLVGVTLALPSLPAHGGLAEFLLACAVAVHDHLAESGGSPAAFLGLAIIVVLALRLLWTLVRSLGRARRARAARQQELCLVATRDGTRDVLVLNHPVPAAFCVPGRHPKIVITTGTLQTLPPHQLEAVLAHERAHLAGRHHLVLVLAGVLKAALPGVRLFADADAALRRLVEMRADDVALRRSSPTALAGALVRLAQGPAPEATLAASAESAVARVHRLVQPQQKVTRHGRATVVLGSAAVLVSPFVVVIVTGGFCPPLSFV